MFVSQCLENVYIYFLLKLLFHLFYIYVHSMHSRSREGKRKTPDNQGLKLSAVVSHSECSLY